ncbi:MAG: cytochrome c maturation protein CcmE [Actinobacteria bacterium]|nr:MAG: cytochrome c maturation protein CcmE [Actinomycetota bacterium]
MPLSHVRRRVLRLMNKRARVRLIVVAVAIAIIGVSAYLVLQGSGQQMLTVADVAGGKVDVGERVKVNGIVIGDSWAGSANPMRFEIKDADKPEPTLKVVYARAVPSGFGDKTNATVTGKLNAAGEFEAVEMMTTCPSKYDSQKPFTIAELQAQKAALTNNTVRITAYVVDPGDGARIVLGTTADGGTMLDVVVAGGTAGLTKGAQVEAAGQLGSDGVFMATGVTVAKTAAP